MKMRVVADRFVETDAGRVVDLATGDPAALVITSAGGPTDQRRWAARCDWFHRLYHPCLARLLDFGPVGDSHRFEAWQCASLAHERRDGGAAEAPVEAAAAFLRACGLTISGRAGAAIVHADGSGQRVVALPSAEDGYEDDAPADRPCEPEHCGIVRVNRRAVAAVGELFEVPVPPQPESPVVCVWGPRDAGRTTAVLDLARVARLHGFVPFSARLLRTPFARVLDGRCAFVIDDGGALWRRGLLDAAIRSPRRHVVVFTAAEDERGVPGASLSRLSAASLIAAVRPEGLALDRRIRRAAERADGRPGRFVRLLHGARDAWAGTGRPVVLVAAERAPSYEVAPREPAEAPKAAWPDAEAVLALREQLAASRARLCAGRHASGDRGLRQAVAALARRGDWAVAAEGALALAGSLLRRSRPREARTVLDTAREYCERTPSDDALSALATLAGVAWIDLGRLGEAEAVLRAATVARPRADEVSGQVALALARCHFWQARYAEADAVLDGLAAGALDRPVTVRLHALRARIAVGRLDFTRAMSAGAEAVRGADGLDLPALKAEATCAAAFAHLAVGDLETLQRDVDASVGAARSARDPLRAFRARLLLAEGLRRGGRRAEAHDVLDGLRRFAATHLPPILRRRYDLARELIACTDGAARITVRQADAAGLPALVLFGQPPETETQAVVDDAVAMLRVCQGAEDEGASLGVVCEHARRRLDAAAVAFFVAEPGSAVRIAGCGSGPDAEAPARAVTAGLPIGPQRLDNRVECAVPIRYGGAVIGALAARWTMNRSPDASRALPVMTMAATAAAPLVQSAASSRMRAHAPASHGLIGISRAVGDLRRAADRAAHAPFAVLVEGESGSGKELVARAIHRSGPRRDRPFRTLNCAALPDDLVESELFGHARGAFTGALAERVGVFEEAHSGTLLLDEIGELSLRAQAKLLRVLQEGELRRIGENTSRRIDVRVVSATNRDLREEAAAGRFRVDLLYRLDVIRISVPALRDRPEDIPVLVEHFWREATGRVASCATLSPGAVAALARYAWPGNVRELQNVLAALAVRVGRRGVVAAAALPPQFAAPLTEPGPRLEAARRAFDERFVRAALVRTGGSRARAAAELGISRQGLAKLMARLGIAEAGQPRAL